MLSLHPTKFNGHRFSSAGDGSADIIVLVCHVILGDQVTKGSSNFLVTSPSK